MSHKVSCYLRTHRRGWCLTQKEVASLLPNGSRNRVSRVERGLTSPNAEEILAYRLIFGCSAKTAFPKLYQKVEEVVMRQAYRLGNRYKSSAAPRAIRKVKLVKEIFARATKGAKRRIP